MKRTVIIGMRNHEFAVVDERWPLAVDRAHVRADEVGVAGGGQLADVGNHGQLAGLMDDYVADHLSSLPDRTAAANGTDVHVIEQRAGRQ